jgi:hypothetical protein
VRSFKTLLYTLLICLSLSIVACESNGVHEDHDGALDIPLQLEIPAGHVQAKVGLSGFIFGTFIMVNAYILIIASIIILVIRDKAANSIIATIKMMVQMMNPASTGSKFMGILDMLSQNDRRVQIGTIGLIIGIILSYFGAWIAT